MAKSISHPAGALRVQVFPENWHLYELPDPSQSQSILWIPFKLSNRALPRKMGRLRTFHLFWNPVELRLAASRFARRLEAEQPAVFARVCLYLELTYDRAWLVRTTGVTDEEIAAEQARLAAGRREREAEKRRNAAA